VYLKYTVNITSHPANQNAPAFYQQISLVSLSLTLIDKNIKM